jgi:hypothetical protein
MIEFLYTNLMSFLTFIGLFILYFVIKNLLPGYFKRKGKNLATKEDISEITELVETVKHSFTEETEKLKANLKLLTNVQVGLASEERNAIINVNESFFSWFNALTDSGLDIEDDYNNLSVDKATIKRNNLYRNFCNSETRLGLFVDNNNLKMKIAKLKIETLRRYVRPAVEYVIKIKKNNTEIENIKKIMAQEGQMEKYKSLLDERKEFLKILSDNIVNNYDEILPMTKDFQKISREHLYGLIKKQEQS